MARVWLGNFDFETHLAGENPSSELERVSAEWVFAFLPVAEAGDVIIVPGEFDRGFVLELQRQLGLPEFQFCSLEEVASRRGDFELMPWGWSPAVEALGRRNGLRMNAPSPNAVRRVHCREFSFRLAHEWGVHPEGVREIPSLDDLMEHVRKQSAEQPWVIKSQWGASGRGQLRRSGNSLSEQDARWAASLLRRDGVLFWEPWLNAIGEAGIQFEIPLNGDPRLIAVVPMLNDRHGQYAGSVVPIANDVALRDQWQVAVEIGLRACRRMQSEGYRGPVGIDAMRYIDDAGTERIRPIQEINARWTMGRLAAAWRRYLPAASTAQWVRSSPVNSDDESFTQRLATSPPSIAGQPTRWRMELRWT